MTKLTAVTNADEGGSGMEFSELDGSRRSRSGGCGFRCAWRVRNWSGEAGGGAAEGHGSLLLRLGAGGKDAPTTQVARRRLLLDRLDRVLRLREVGMALTRGPERAATEAQGRGAAAAVASRAGLAWRQWFRPNWAGLGRKRGKGRRRAGGQSKLGQRENGQQAKTKEGRGEKMNFLFFFQIKFPNSFPNDF